MGRKPMVPQVLRSAEAFAMPFTLTFRPIRMKENVLAYYARLHDALKVAWGQHAERYGLIGGPAHPYDLNGYPRRGARWTAPKLPEPTGRWNNRRRLTPPAHGFQVGDTVEVKPARKRAKIAKVLVEDGTEAVVLLEAVDGFKCWNMRDLKFIRRARGEACPK